MKKFIQLSIFFLMSFPIMAQNFLPIENFDAKKFLGTWYEIGRFNEVSYSDIDNTIFQLSGDAAGKLNLLNTGFDPTTNKWKSSAGKLKFLNPNGTGAMEAQIFNGAAVEFSVLALDDLYQYALVGSKDLKNLWILSRERTLSEEIKNRYLAIADDMGFNTSNLIWVAQDKEKP